MNMVVINLIGILVIGIIIGWFWFNKPRVINSKNLVEITVKDGVYHPALIEARINEPITLRFIREDASPCAERVNFPTLNISKILSLQASTDIPLLVQQPGEYEFSCQMNMYRGKLMIIA